VAGVRWARPLGADIDSLIAKLNLDKEILAEADEDEEDDPA
jgi:hypothetical protein